MQVEEKEISRAVIKRLPRYYRYLGELLESGTERISSGELSERMQVTASQIRQDLNNFGGFGQQGYGYNVKHLHTEIGKILGLDQRKWQTFWWITASVQSGILPIRIFICRKM